MSPVLKQVNDEGIRPVFKGEITQEQAFERGDGSHQGIYAQEYQQKDLNTFISLAKLEKPKTYDDIPTEVLIPAFITKDELKRAL